MVSSKDALVLAVLLASVARAQVTQRVSVGAGGEADGLSYRPSISGDGRFVVFSSQAVNLAPGDTDPDWDVFLRDRRIGTTECISVDSHGAQGNGHSFGASISEDGRYVAFISRSTNLVLDDTNGVDDVFLRDLQRGITERVSISSGGREGDDQSSDGLIALTYSTTGVSSDGGSVVFVSAATNLVPGDTNGVLDVFLRDRWAATTERVTVASDGAQAFGRSGSQGGFSISGDGRFVAFHSEANDLVPGDTNAAYDVFVRDRASGTTERVSVSPAGVQGDDGSYSPSISGDGRFVAFTTWATNIAGGFDGDLDVFVKDRRTGSIEHANAYTDHWWLPGAVAPSISSGGRCVAFVVNGWTGDEVFLRDLEAGTTEWVSANLREDWIHFLGDSVTPSVSGDGRFVALSSASRILVPEDTNTDSDVFVRDRAHPAYPSLCEPGSSGVVLCPCSNQPSGAGRGCDNSSGGGGAILSAFGGAFLSSDSLALTSSAQPPAVLGLLWQSSGFDPAGRRFGMGVRCASGTMKRLYTKPGSSDGIRAPDFSVPDLPVSARSAALGDPILAGQSRWYFVAYRDAVVLGGCPASSTFNATQAREVTWAP